MRLVIGPQAVMRVMRDMVTVGAMVVRLGVGIVRCRRRVRGSRLGMRTMREDGVLKVLTGQTTLNELARTVA